MALFADCNACQEGQHDGHREVVQAPPRDGVGGQVCRCTGDCAERNLVWVVAYGTNTAQMIPAERAQEKRDSGWRVEGPMTGDAARLLVHLNRAGRTGTR